MAIETRVFERIGIHVAPRDLEALIVDALDRVVPSRIVPDLAGELTPEESAALRRGGVDLAWRADSTANPIVRTAAEYAALLASSLTVAQSAQLLGVESSRIRHRLADRTLYGIKARSGWRLPAFQFTGSGLVPGIDRVLPRLAPTLHPLAVVGWFTRPHSDLSRALANAGPVSPLDWLQMGRSPDVVAHLAAGAGEYG